ncbi:MAG: gliding motility-associated protein GldE [Bacteroidaceae bacterium]|nr:gliding motility-associated protein GldE [Bacteroidaceae bacterium]
MEIGVLVAIVLAVLLLLVSGFVSASEIAFFSLAPKDISELENSKEEKDRKIEMLRNESQRTLATILITNNCVNVTIIMLCNYAFSRVLHFSSPLAEFIVITVILTFLLLLFGEIAPKVFSSQNPLRFCRFAVNGIMFFRRLFWHVETLLMSTGKVAEKVVSKETPQLTVDDLEQALDLTDESEIKEEQSMLEGIIRFGDETVREIMTSRQDIVDLNITASYREVLQLIVSNKYSRVPVYQDTGDNIRGVLYVKDLLPHLGKPSSFRWQTLIRPAYFVPETKKVDDLLSDFQKTHVHMAIVVDEFGGTSGIITMEDIIEEIVGEINDEYDDDSRQYTRLNKNTYIFEGKTQLADFNRLLDIDDDYFDDMKGEADTLAGLLLELKGEFPAEGEVLTAKDFSFEIIEMDNRRILKVKVIKCN